MINRDQRLQANSGTRTMRTAVSSQRRKLGDDGENRTYVFTEMPVGYRSSKRETKKQTEA